MGARIIALAGQDDRFEVTAAVEAAGHPKLGQTVGGVPVDDKLPADCDVLIDFSVPASTSASIPWAVSAGVAMVIGTTGHDEAQTACIRDAASGIAILRHRI